MIINVDNWLSKKNDTFADAQVVEGLGRKNKKIEEWFYRTAKRYYDEHFNDVFFDKDGKQEIFQEAFLKIWMEIDNGKITVRDGKVCRQQSSGAFSPMTCSLTTFLMTFAKNENREKVRSNHLTYCAEIYDDSSNSTVATTEFDIEEDAATMKNRIVDDCIQKMPPRCKEILTLFYYQGKSLDEIMELRGEKNTSKNGLKSAKSKCMNTLRDRIAEQFGIKKLA